jgi:penicillin-binding protein 1A
MMVELLKGVVNFGTAVRLRYRYKFRNDIGGKTGTTQNQSDGWFMGITPNLATGVWVGHADRRMHFRSIKYGQGANMALPIWAEYYQALYDDPNLVIPQLSFERPEGVTVNVACGSIQQEEAQPQRTPASADDFDKFD